MFYSSILCLFTNATHYIFLLLKNFSWSFSTFCLVWLNYSSNNLSLLAPVPGSAIFSSYFKPFVKSHNCCYQLCWCKPREIEETISKAQITQNSIIRDGNFFGYLQLNCSKIQKKFWKNFPKVCYFILEQDNYKYSQTIFQRKIKIFMQAGKTEGMVGTPHIEKAW